MLLLRPLSQARSQVLFGEFDIRSSGLSRAFLECMEYVDSFDATRRAQNTVLAAGMHSDLDDTGSDRRHRPPIARLEPELDAMKLVARFAAGGGREPSQASQGSPDPEETFLSTSGIYRYLYRLPAAGHPPSLRASPVAGFVKGRRKGGRAVAATYRFLYRPRSYSPASFGLRRCSS